MFKEERVDKILCYIDRYTQATVDELSKEFNVSAMTIRRDLDALEKAKLVNRTHGGAMSNSIDILRIEELYEQKQEKNLDTKIRIAEKAAELIGNDKIIFLDAGTTTYQIALQIKRLFSTSLTIFTNDVKIASELYDSPHQIFIVGGRVQRETGSVIGNLANQFLQSLNFDICFVGAQAINQNLYLLTPSEEKVLIKQALLDKSPRKVLACDQSKFNRKGLFNIIPVEEFDYVVTDYEFPAEDALRLKHGSTEIINL